MEGCLIAFYYFLKTFLLKLTKHRRVSLLLEDVSQVKTPVDDIDYSIRKKKQSLRDNSIEVVGFWERRKADKT